MRARDYADGRLKSLDLGNLGDNDKGVKIQLQNVWFRYPTRDVSILNGLDMTVRLPKGPLHEDLASSIDLTVGIRLRRANSPLLLAHQVC